jgi:hypothetical protein
MTARNVERRRRREFNKMVDNHQLFITLLVKSTEIRNHYEEMQEVLWDFYKAGISKGLLMGLEALDDARNNPV